MRVWCLGVGLVFGGWVGVGFLFYVEHKYA